MRRRRQWIVALLIVGLAYAQVVTAAHACTMLAPGSQVPAQASVPADQAMPADCPEMAKQFDSSLNVCLSHCDFGQQVDVHTDVPTAAIAPQVALTIRLAVSHVCTNVDGTTLLASLAAPPPQLLFSRFLI